MNPFLKSLNVACGEQIHVASWPVAPGNAARQHPDPATNTGEQWADLITPVYAIETCTWTLAPFQRLSVDGLKKNTPAGLESETDPDLYNGWARIFAPDGTCVAKADKDFDGLLLADVSTHRLLLALVCLFLQLMMITDLLLDRPQRDAHTQGHN